MTDSCSSYLLFSILSRYFLRSLIFIFSVVFFSRSDRSTYLTKILAEGEKSLRKGDQESAYRHFMTYIEIVSYIQRSENDKKYLTSMFGSTAMETISVLEKLDEELVARYVCFNEPYYILHLYIFIYIFFQTGDSSSLFLRWQTQL